MIKASVFGLVPLALAFIGCDGGLPVKYEICGTAEEDCHVYARFRNFEDCETHREYGRMHCRKSPGRMVCEEPTEPSTIATSRCTR